MTTLASAQLPGRKPLGVYAKVDVKEVIRDPNGCPQTNPARQHECLQKLYESLLTAPPAIAGLTVGLHWDLISTSVPSASKYIFGGNDWSWVDDVFTAVAHAGKQQTVQFIITPGFDTPKWLLDTMHSCDPLLTGPAPVPGAPPLDCGKVTFRGSPEKSHSDGNDLPLPWFGPYLLQWIDFLGELQQKYFFTHPEWVALALAGPSGPSPELILPAEDDDTAPQKGGLTVTEVWTRLLMNSFSSLPGGSQYLDNDEAIVAQFKNVIFFNEALFGGALTSAFEPLTLILVPDSGGDYPNFSNVPPHTNPLYAADCASTLTKLSCEAKTDILSYFREHAAPKVTGATQVGGLTASSTLAPGSIGIAGVKLLTAGGSNSPSPPFLGGAEFDHPVSTQQADQLQQDGCPSYKNGQSQMCKLTPEEAAYNLLAVFFDQTPEYGFWSVNLKNSPRPPEHQGSCGESLIQFLDVPYKDIQYAERNPAGNSPDFANTSNQSLSVTTSLTDLLNQASSDLLAMASQPAPKCPKP